MGGSSALRSVLAPDWGCKDSFWVILLISAIMAGESRIECKNGGSTQALLEQAFLCSGDGTTLNPLHQMKDHLKALTWNEVTHKAVVWKGHFARHFMGVGEKCMILNAHFATIRPQRKKETNKIQTGMHVCVLRYHCNCSYSLVYSYRLERIVFSDFWSQRHFGL